MTTTELQSDWRAEIPLQVIKKISNFLLKVARPFSLLGGWGLVTRLEPYVANPFAN